MDIMELVKELALKDEKEHKTVLFADEYAQFYHLCLEESRVKDAYIRRRAYDYNGLHIPGYMVLHITGESCEESLTRFNKVKNELSKIAKKEALVLGYPVVGIDNQRFYTGMDYDSVPYVIKDYYAGITEMSADEIEKLRLENERKSRVELRRLFDLEPVPYSVRRRLLDMAYIYECCSNYNEIAAYIDAAEVEIEAFYSDIKFDREVLDRLTTICLNVIEQIDDIYMINDDKCIRTICEKLIVHHEETDILKMALYFVYLRSMIDSESKGAKLTRRAVIAQFDNEEILNAALSRFNLVRRVFRDESEWENYSVRVVYERYVREHKLKENRIIYIQGYNEPITEISNGNNQLVKSLWIMSKMPIERLVYKPYKAGKVICYYNGIASKDKVIRFKELLTDSIRVISNWFKIQGYDPVFCKDGLNCNMLYKYNLHLGMTSDECEYAIALYLDSNKSNGGHVTKKLDVKKYRSEIRRIAAGYRYNHDKYSEYEILEADTVSVDGNIVSADKKEVLEALAEQYYLPELLRQTDNLGKSFLELLNKCVLSYMTNPPKSPVAHKSISLFGKLGKHARNSTRNYDDLESRDMENNDIEDENMNPTITSLDMDAGEVKDEYYVPYCYINKKTNSSMAICLLFNYSRLGKADIIFPVPVVFGVTKGGGVRLVTEYDSFFTGDNSLSNFKEVKYNSFMRYADWLNNYVLVK